jgi:flagellar biosynthesis protein
MSDLPDKPALAVALDYAEGSNDAPRVVATGRGEMAERIIAAAREHGVTIEANPMLAEALSGVPVDEAIPRELYEAVAEIIGFVLRAQRRWRP